MSLFKLVGELAPRIRPDDLLTEDHPGGANRLEGWLRRSAWTRGIVFLVVMMVAIVLYLSILLAIIGPYDPFASLLGVPVAQLLGAVAGYTVLSFVMEARVWPFELVPRRSGGLLKGILTGFLLVCLSVAILALLGVYRIESFNPAYNPWPALLTAGLVAGVSEELMMRGVVFRLVEEGLGSWGAVAVSGLAFGAMHLGNSDASLWGALAVAIEGGLLIGAVYLLTRSLWWCIGLHLAWNLSEGPLFGSVVSGTGAIESWLVSSWNGPEILSGGAFGLEASIVAVLLLGGLAITLLIYAQTHHLMVRPIWVRRSQLARPAGETTDPSA